MKKIISVLLICVLLCSCFVGVSADDSEKAAQLILSVKDRVDINDELFVFDNYSKDDNGENVVYNLSWKSKKDDDYSYQPRISVSVFEDGEISHYYLSDVNTYDITLQKFSKEEIAAKAKACVEKISPARFAKLAEPVIETDTQIMVSFERVENGIPVYNDGIDITFSPKDLTLIRYNADWTEVEFPDPKDKISIEQARQAYAENIGHELLYNIITKNNQIDRIYPSYQSRASGAYISAFTGEAVTRTSSLYKSDATFSSNDAVQLESAKGLSPEEQKMVDEISNMITKESAEKLLRSIPELNIRKDAEVQSFGVAKNRYGNYVSSISFGLKKEDEKDYYYADAAIDADTKEILSFGYSRYMDEDTMKKSFDKDLAQKKAMAFLDKFYKDKLALCKEAFVLGEKDGYRFSFDRYENGARVNGNGVRLSVNRHTGEINSLSCVWADTEFPSVENVVAPNFIYKDLLAEDNFRLQYITSVEYSYDEKTGKHTSKKYSDLVYAVVESHIYDAFTGRKIDRRGDIIREKFTGYTDLSGHYSEGAAKELAQINIYFDGGLLAPEKEISQAEFLRFIYQVMYNGYYENPEYIYRHFIGEGIITEDEIGKPLTRINAIRYLISSLGYKKAAEIQGIYKCGFTDIGSDDQGYAAIAGGLGIINTDTPYFRPSDIMTRGEAITVIHNYFVKNR